MQELPNSLRTEASTPLRTPLSPSYPTSYSRLSHCI